MDRSGHDRFFGRFFYYRFELGSAHTVRL